ncbi:MULTISPECIES: hypothetical protein [unclassified Streptomyces]|uniref:hypothetical protein n=1 Tax=unclassified Streptomyces TaxID=2593676 RepID=UPI001BFFD28C|nr:MULTISPECIES: hypothetical protein [unclassified Streptomyces]
MALDGLVLVPLQLHQHRFGHLPPRERLLPLIDVAVTARILVWDADPDEHTTGRYRFPELHREVVLSALTPSARQLLHAALARELTHWEGAEPARLARHLRAAGPMAPTAARGR